MAKHVVLMAGPEPSSSSLLVLKLIKKALLSERLFAGLCGLVCGIGHHTNRSPDSGVQRECQAGQQQVPWRKILLEPPDQRWRRRDGRECGRD